MKTRLYTTAQRLSLVLTINLHARTDAALTKDGLAIMTTIAEMDRMKENSAMRNTRRARLKSSLARTSNVFAINTDAVS